jgi:hypothetical protein
MPEAKRAIAPPPDDEPRLAQAFAGALGEFSSDRAAAILTRAAYLSLHRRTMPVTDETALAKSGVKVFEAVVLPDFLLDIDSAVDESDPRLQLLQRLVDQVGAKRFDARMQASMAKSIEAILQGTQWLTAVELGRAARPSAANPHSISSRWRAAKRCFAIQWRGQLLFPRYAFDEQFEPRPAVAKVLEILGESTALELASVVQAAKDSLVGSAHG